MSDSVVLEPQPMPPDVLDDLVEEIRAAGFDVEVTRPIEERGAAPPPFVVELTIRVAETGIVGALALAVRSLRRWAKRHFRNRKPPAGIRLARIYGPDGEVLSEVEVPREGEEEEDLPGSE